ncbi:hypothetical protein [Rhodopirellula sp. SWK7]|uniref:hypothetical protein n=1 Tax=Rhodopirellula sp. SWK7 TaxID=595460 RepID=UPI0005C71693|nr:hypothetical protein [Rhodopirellula sp. SWK7]
MFRIEVKSKKPVARSLAKEYRAASTKTWGEVGREDFHKSRMPSRFTPEHAKEAGYTPRQGERMTRQNKLYPRSYTGRKERKFGHRNPLEYSGESKRNAKATAVIISDSSGVRVKYPGLRKLNLRHSNSNINMADEFRRITTRENRELGDAYDTRFTRNFNP